MRLFIFTLFTFISFVDSGLSQKSIIDSTWASEKDILIQQFTQSNGLPINSVSGLVYHSDGFMYLSSLGGLTRFDGFTFTTLNSRYNVHLPESRFTHIGSLKNGNLFLMSETGTNYIFNPNNPKQGFFTLPLGHSAVLTDSLLSASFNSDSIVFYNEALQIRAIEYIKAEKLQSFFIHSSGWQIQHTNKALSIKTSKGLNRIENDQLPFNFLEPINGKRFLKIIELDNHFVGIIGFSGIILIDPNGKMVFQHRFIPDYFAVNVLAITNDQYLITGHMNYFEVDIHSGTVKKVTQFEQTFASETAFPTIWKNKAFYLSYDRIQWGNKELYKAKGSQELWFCYQHPKTGDLWIGTQGNGLLRLFSSYFYTLNSAKGLTGENIYGLEGTHVENLLLSTFDQGLIQLQKTTSKVLNNEYRLARSVVTSNFPPNVYSGKWGGLLDRYNLKTGEFNRLNMQNNDTLFHYSDVNSLDLLFKDSQKRIWIGTRVQLVRLSADEKKYSRILNSRFGYIGGITSMVELASELFIMSSIFDGLYVYRNGRMTQLMHHQLSNAVRDIFVENDSTFWLATENKGIQYVQLNTRLDSVLGVYSLNASSGFPHNMVHRILSDQLGFFWVSTNQGLLRLNIQELKKTISSTNPSTITYQTFTTQQGLPTNEFNGGASQSGLVLQNHDLLFPSQNGLVLVKPNESQFLAKDTLASIYVKTVSYGDTVVHFPLSNKISLNHENRYIGIQLGINSFLTEKNYQIQFETNQSNRWENSNENNTLYFSGLSTGEQTFRFRLAHQNQSDQKWLRFTVYVKPYFYETIEFKLILGLCLIFAVIFIFLQQKNKRERLENRLTKEVIKRTKEIEKERINTQQALSIIEQQAAKLEAITQYKEDVFMGITHELKTPLALIQGPLEVIQESLEINDLETIQRQVRIIGNNSKRLQDLVKKVLTTIQYTGESDTFSMKYYDSESLIQSCVLSLKEEADSKQIAIHVEFEHEHKKVVTDIVAFELILNNIIQNAIKYSYENTTCTIVSQFDDQFWVISITDQGIGIEENQLVKIFDPYFRVTHSEKNPGAGIGLTIANRICTMMNGKIEVSSKPAKGSTFIVYLPQKNVPILPDDTIQPITLSNRNTSIHTKDYRKRILLVDDNPEFLQFLSEVLQNDYTLHTAENGESALQILKANPIDVIISDVMMPGIGGLELARQVNENPDYRNIAFMFISADEKASTIQKGLSFGAEVYLTKPIHIETLRTNLSGLLLRSQNLPLEKNSTFLSTQVEEIILKHLTDAQLSVDHIAHVLGMSRSNLYGKWSESHPLSINDFITYIRIRETFRLMYKDNLNVSQACIACGFKYSAYMSRVFKKKYGITPTEFIQKYPSKIPGMINP